MSSRRVALALAVGALAAVGGTGGATAASVVVGTSVESWYATLPSIEPRPAGTLHVGVVLGVEESRSYLALDLSGIDADRVTGGQLRLAVDAPASRSLDQAAVDVCLAGSPGPAVEGSTEEPPLVDCAGAVPAVYDATAGDLVADLAPFASALGTSGLALVPKAGAAPTAAWHVTIKGTAGAAPGTRPIRATLSLPDPDPATTVAPVPPAAPRSDQPPSVGPVLSDFADDDNAFASVTGFAVVPVAPAEEEEAVGLGPLDASVAAPVVAQPTVERRPVGAFGVRPPNSVAFALPLVLLVLGGYLGSALTRPAPPAPAPVPAGPRRGRRRGARARGPSTGD